MKIATLDVVDFAACPYASLALVCSYPSDRYSNFLGPIGSRCGTLSNGSIAPQTFLTVDARDKQPESPPPAATSSSL